MRGSVISRLGRWKPMVPAFLAVLFACEGRMETKVSPLSSCRGKDCAANPEGTTAQFAIDPVPRLITSPSFLIHWPALGNARSYQLAIKSGQSCQGGAIVLEFPELRQPQAHVHDLAEGAYVICLTARLTSGRDVMAVNQGLSFRIGSGGENFAITSALPAPVQADGIILTWEDAANALSYDVTVTRSASCDEPVTRITVVRDAQGDVGTLAEGVYFACVQAQDWEGGRKPARNQPFRFVVKESKPILKRLPLSAVAADGYVNAMERQLPGNLVLAPEAEHLASASYALVAAGVTCETETEYRAAVPALSQLGPLPDGAYKVCIRMTSASELTAFGASASFTLATVVPSASPLTLVNDVVDGILTATERLARKDLVAPAPSTSGVSVSYAVGPAAVACPNSSPYGALPKADAAALGAYGSYKVCVRFEDVAGNAAFGESPSFQYRADYAPSPAFTSPGASDVHVERKADATVTYAVTDMEPGATIDLFHATTPGASDCAGATALALGLTGATGSATLPTLSFAAGTNIYLCALYHGPGGLKRHAWSSAKIVIDPFCTGSKLTAAPQDMGGGTAADPYSVCTVGQLQQLGADPTGTYALEQDIDASSTATWNGGAGFAPITTPSGGFGGVLLGRGFTIRGLVIQRPGEANVGLFQKLSTAAEIRQLKLAATVSGLSQVGLVAGYAQGALITDCDVRGDVTVATDEAGALAGRVEGAHVSHVVVAGTVTGGDASVDVGGLLGVASDGTALDDVRSYADVSVPKNSSRIGGMIGSSENSIVTGAAAFGQVTVGGSGHELGGFVGASMQDVIRDSYAVGDVTVTGSIPLTISYQGSGGFAGIAEESTIQRCFALGNVNSGKSPMVGGFIGAAYFATIRDAWSSGNATSLFEDLAHVVSVGGFVGMNYQGEVRNAYALGDVYNPVSAGSGGFVGYMGEGASGKPMAQVVSAFATGRILLDNQSGGFAGYNDGLSGAPSDISADSRWDVTLSGMSQMCFMQRGLATGCDDAKGVVGDSAYFHDANNPPMANWNFGAGGDWKTAPQTYPALAWQKTHVIFTTSRAYDGNLGGLAGADALCQTHASEAGLAGGWKAVLSDDAQSAWERLRIIGPVYDRAGGLVAQHVRALWSGALLRPPRFDENGVDLGSASKDVWSATAATGRWVGAGPGSEACVNWTSRLASASGTSGQWDATDARWVAAAVKACDQALRLFCISQ